MPLPAYYYSTPSLNVSINGINIGEGMARSDMNNALRQMMADIKTWTDAYAVTVPISIAQGGTGQITAPLGLAALGGLGSAYQRLPQVAKSAAFTLDTTMDGGHVRYTGAAAAGTINPNATTNLPRDYVTVLVNDGSGAVTITRGAGVALIWASSGADANRVLAVGGIATLLQVSTDRWFITGAGLS
jgi:hypothetical protein